MKSMLKRWREKVALRVLLSVFALTLAAAPATLVAGKLAVTHAAVAPCKNSLRETIFAPNLNWLVLRIKSRIQRATGLRVEMDMSGPAPRRTRSNEQRPEAWQTWSARARNKVLRTLVL